MVSVDGVLPVTLPSSVDVLALDEADGALSAGERQAVSRVNPENPASGAAG